MQAEMLELFERDSLRSFLEVDQNQSTLSEEQMAFLQRLEKVECRPGEKVITEGEKGDSLYILDRGTAKVVKESEGSKVIGELHAGDFFGELALFTGKPRTASIVVEEDAILYRLNKLNFQYLIENYPNINLTLLSKLSGRLAGSFQNLEEKYEELKRVNQVRMEFSFIFIGIVVIISIYTFILGLFGSELLKSSPTVSFIIDRTVETAALIFIIRIIMKSSLPLRSFGLTLKDWKPALKLSMIVTALVVILLTAIKYVAIYEQWPILDQTPAVNWSNFNWTYVTYLIIAPLQEFIARGVLQSSIERLLIGRFSPVWANVVTSFLFGAMHLNTSVNLGIAALLSSLLWGWMYTRYRSLVGVSVSHFIIGNWAGLLGIWALF